MFDFKDDKVIKPIILEKENDVMLNFAYLSLVDLICMVYNNYIEESLKGISKIIEKK